MLTHFILYDAQSLNLNQLPALLSSNRSTGSPIIENLNNSLGSENQRDMINILVSELENIISPFSKLLTDKMINLTPMEIHIADLVKLGKTNKEMAVLLNSSPHTISHHRENIRKKLGIKNKKINLRTYLSSLY